MSFTVPTGILAGSYDAVLLSTDLEPDDAVALTPCVVGREVAGRRLGHVHD